MLKALFIALSATATGWAAPPDEPSSRVVGAALNGPWSELSISAMVMVDSCMGPEYVGFRLTRENERITISKRTERGKIVLGPTRELSKGELEDILRITASHYQAALASKSSREALEEKIAHLPLEDQLKEIARVSRTTGLKTLGISIAFGDRVTDSCFENEFGGSDGAAFAKWVADAVDPKTSSK